MIDDTFLVLAFVGLSVILSWQSAWVSQKSSHSLILRVQHGWPSQVLHWLYFLSFPYLAVILGLIPVRLFGLKGLEYLTLPSLNQPPAELGTAILSLMGNMLLTWLGDVGPIAYGTGFGVLGLVGFLALYRQAVPQGFFLPPPYFSKTGVLFDVVHWAFYRAAMWFVLGDVYVGLWLGAALILLEYAILSRLAADFQARQRYLLRFALGLVASLLFLFAPNLWLVGVAHLFLAGVLGLVSGSKGVGEVSAGEGQNPSASFEQPQSQV